jgi:hypothetical protein
MSTPPEFASKLVLLITFIEHAKTLHIKGKILFLLLETMHAGKVQHLFKKNGEGSFCPQRWREKSSLVPPAGENLRPWEKVPEGRMRGKPSPLGEGGPLAVEEA